MPRPVPPRASSKLADAYADVLGGAVSLVIYGVWALGLLFVIGLALRLVVGVAGLG